MSCNGESYSSIMRFSLVFHSSWSWDSEWQTLDISDRPWRVLLIINWKGKDVLIIFFLDIYVFSRMLLYPSISVSDGFKQFLPDESRPVYATLPLFLKNLILVFDWSPIHPQAADINPIIVSYCDAAFSITYNTESWRLLMSSSWCFYL